MHQSAATAAQGLRAPIETGPARSSVWTCDDWGRLLAGGTVGLCLAVSQLVATGLEKWFLWAALLVGVHQVITTLAGWCPVKLILLRLGVPERPLTD